jgi:hypothetical protein
MEPFEGVVGGWGGSLSLNTNLQSLSSLSYRPGLSESAI